MSVSDRLASQVGAAARQSDVRVGVAESLTGGLVASRLAAAPRASVWFRGAIVAYSRDVKHHLLGVPDGPVVSRESALAMADGAARLLEADLVVAVTGAGGPESQDGQPPGTVWLAVRDDRGGRAQHFQFDEPDPAAVCDRACEQALRALLAALGANADGRPDGAHPTGAPDAR